MRNRRALARRAAIALSLAAVPLGAQASQDTAVASAAPRSPLTPPGARTITIFPDSLPDVPRTMSELLAMGAPGVFVQHSSGATGAGAWVSIRDGAAVRGAEPLIVVDGIATVALVPRFREAGELRAPSRLDEIPVEDVERVDVLAGPAAAARYGREARAGVIEITTRAVGRGAPRLRASLAGRGIASGNDFPRNYALLGTDRRVCSQPSFQTECASPVASSYTPLLDASPFRPAASRQAHLGASGGVAAVGYALDLSHEAASGVLAADGADLSTAAARFAVPLPFGARLALVSRASLRGATIPFEGNSSLIAAGLQGGADCTPDAPCAFGDSSSRGYGSAPPDELARRGMKHRAQHVTNGATLTADPLPWLALRSVASVDVFGDRGGYAFSQQQSVYLSRTATQRDERAVRDVLAQDVVAHRAFGASELSATLAFRGDHERAHSYAATERYSTNLAYGLTSTDATASWYRASVRRQTTTLAPRLSSARGSIGVGATSVRTRLEGLAARTPATIDGSADASLVVADHAAGLLRSVVVRGAVGQVTAYDVSNDRSYFPPLGFGFDIRADTSVRPDRSFEGEGGVDLVLGSGEARVSLTGFRRRETHFGMYSGSSPSLGSYPPSLVSFTPLRRVVKGAELAASFVPLALPAARLETALNFTLQGDRVVSDIRPFLLPAYGSRESYIRNERGRSFASWSAAQVTGSDLNGDGWVSGGELTVVRDAMRARSRPSWFGTLDTRLILAGRWTVDASLAYQGGHKVLDKVESSRCIAHVCEAARSTAVDDQVYVRGAGSTAYFVSGEALRVRELSLGYGLPELARFTHAGAARVTLAVRNVATFSHARYLDPETELPSPGFGGSPSQGPGLALARTVSLRVSLGR